MLKQAKKNLDKDFDSRDKGKEVGDKPVLLGCPVSISTFKVIAIST